MATTSSLSTSWGSERANSVRESLDRMYSAAHESSSLRIDEPSGVSCQTCTNRGVAGMCWVMRRHSDMASSEPSQSPSMPSSWPSFQTPMSTS